MPKCTLKTLAEKTRIIPNTEWRVIILKDRLWAMAVLTERHSQVPTLVIAARRLFALTAVANVWAEILFAAVEVYNEK